MKIRALLFLILTTASLGFAGAYGAEPIAAGPSAGAAPTGEARLEPSDNLCFGGLEDGKLIVTEPFLENPYRQTTRLGCEVDGGSPATMPDLPAPDAAKTRLA